MIWKWTELWLDVGECAASASVSPQGGDKSAATAPAAAEHTDPVLQVIIKEQVVDHFCVLYMQFSLQVKWSWKFAIV